MSQRQCDRCCAESQVRWTKDAARLELCRHHSNQHGPALTAQGWKARQMIDPASDTRPGGPLIKR